MKIPVYLDHHATTPMDPRVLEVVLPYFCEKFGNAGSRNHSFGWEAEAAVDDAREQVAAMIGARSPQEIFFTSGATESDNLALKGIAACFKPERNHIVTCVTEHKAVLDTCKSLEKRGFNITYLPVDQVGALDLDRLSAAITKKTCLVSVMAANNEIGTIHPMKEIGRIVREKGALLHCDGTQGVGKIPLNVTDMGIDLLSLSAHKIYGPKGIGALYVRRKPRVRLEAQMHGGGHERGMRSGTLATHQIVGMGEAFHLAKEEMATDNERIRMLRDRLLKGLEDIEESYINGDMEQRIPHNLNISFNFVEGESMMMALKDLAVSSGSACTSASLEPSYVLRALGRNDELAHSSIRFTIGRFTTEEEIDYAIEDIKNHIGKLRELSPLWEMYKDGIDLDSIEWTAH